jgi:glucosamine--fructose-6-phosphate aminotransferase (isomerizing)
MCGIFLFKPKKFVKIGKLKKLGFLSMRRGRDSSGLLFYHNQSYQIVRADQKLTKTIEETDLKQCSLVIGHSRLITNGQDDNQPIVGSSGSIVHNGIIVNELEGWRLINSRPALSVDTEVLLAIFEKKLAEGMTLEDAANFSLKNLKGTISAILLLPKLGKALAFSNNGSLYCSESDGEVIVASEMIFLKKIGCKKIDKIIDFVKIIDVPSDNHEIKIDEKKVNRVNLLPELGRINAEEQMLEYKRPQLRRCTRCVLPETMPFIRFNGEGVCNYCENYSLLNKNKPKEELYNLIRPYIGRSSYDCIVPFSGGRDSSYGLHIIVKELGLKPLTYTYDWGMVTDLARRNISRMCSSLKVENIIVAADIVKKRENINKNLLAWLNSPHLGMLNILMAGDKHFFRYSGKVKRENNIDLELWGTNPLEVTHFKAGFLGIPPKFAENNVYSQGLIGQLRYQKKRLSAMLESPGYFNSSIFDTIYGEYHRSIASKENYHHIYDYWTWNEGVVNDALDKYDWERAPDTASTWRIGDGTAAFYNYVYYTIAGFSEHDTLRSNQIREGQLSREDAIILLQSENRPRYQNIKWYLDAVNVDFSYAIGIINNTPKKYSC